MTLLLTALACTTDDAEDFTGGDFQITTTAVDDGCYDGAINTVFLPDGDDSTNDWANPTYLPGWDELPATYTIALQDPFSDMEVTMVDGGAQNLVVDGASQTAVELDADQYPGCTADMSIYVDITVVSAGEISATATLTTSNTQGDTCPTITSDPCDITLDLVGARL